ncbi:MAG: fructosamine kinase family protein [Proteobacteria bacterium]|nr:fructosamine kinase family protein [Pseudomonadota bacterium]
MEDYQPVEAALGEHFAEPVKIASRISISGGCINQAWKLELSNGQAVFMKENSARFENMFHAEAIGLKALRVAGGPRVPVPISVHGNSDSQFILMSYIAEGPRGKNYWEKFGRSFATLHRHHGKSFGFSENNYIGSTPQVNTTSIHWPEFFGTYRLGYQIGLAAKQGLADATLVLKTENLISKLVELLPNDPRPSILHGDLWGGNVMTGKDGTAVIIDPATYWGHFEADLAMTELFGSFPANFYRAYNELLPISPEYGEIKEIYNLYHVLNHLNMFGSSYTSQATAIVNRFL